jgi:bacterial/archaeal transporter family protein
VNPTAIAAATFAMVFWGSAAVCDKFGMRGLANPWTALVVRMGFGALVILVAGFFTGAYRDLATASPVNLVALAAGGLLASVLGQGAYFVALKHAEASRVVPFSASYPIVALLLSALLLREPLTWTKVLGTLMVLGGVMLVAGIGER